MNFTWPGRNGVYAFGNEPVGGKFADSGVTFSEGKREKAFSDGQVKSQVDVVWLFINWISGSGVRCTFET